MRSHVPQDLRHEPRWPRLENGYHLDDIPVYVLDNLVLNIWGKA